jgi:hypothetical protein
MRVCVSESATRISRSFDSHTLHDVYSQALLWFIGCNADTTQWPRCSATNWPCVGTSPSSIPVVGPNC